MVLKNVSLFALLLPSSLLDLKQRKIWLPWLLLFFVEGIILIVAGINSCKFCFAGMLPGMILMIVSLLSAGAIGLGDGYLVCVIGCLVGVERTMVILTAALFLSAVTGMLLMVFLRWGRKRTMPFVPFLFLAYIMQMVIC